MACILQSECNFLRGFFICHLPVEMVDVEVRITSMQGTHTFRRDRTCQIIKYNPWSTRLHPHPTIIKKMKTFLELEGKLGPKFQPQSDQSIPTQPITNPCVRKETKTTEKRKKFIPTKKYKVKVVARPKSKTNNTTAQPPSTTPNTPTNSERQNPPQEGTSDSNSPLFKNIPTCAGTPWPEGKSLQVEEGLADPSSYYSKTPHKKQQTQELAASSSTAAPKAEKCRWGLNCPICKNLEEDWDGDPPKTISAECSKYTASATPGARSSVPPDPELSKTPKLPVLLVTDI